MTHSRRTTRLPLRPIALSMLLGATGCTCGSKPQERADAHAPPTSDGGICESLAPDDSTWRAVRGDFFELRLPSPWVESPGSDGPQYRDNARHRKLELTMVAIRPGPGVRVAQTLDTLVDGVRAKAKDLGPGVTMGPTRSEGTSEHPIRFFLVTSRGQFFVAGLVGRATVDGAVRGVSVTYADEDPSATPACTEEAGLALMKTIRVPNEPLGAPKQPIIRFTPAAVAELRRELREGDLVWVAATQTGGEIEHMIEVRSDLPPDTPTTSIEGIPVVVDPGSEALLSGVSVDHVPGRGFKFDGPGAGP